MSQTGRFRPLYILSIISASVISVGSGITPSFPAQASSAGFLNRCGWIDNPTPANWWLTDRDGEWVIGAQGGHQAEGDLPEFPNNSQYWVKTNGNYGYGCACLMMRANPNDKQVIQIKSGRALPLSKCRLDPALKAR